MAKNLLHSMSHFAEIFEVLLAARAPKTLVEVGSEYAGSTRILASYAQIHDAMLYVVDPAPKTDMDAALAEFTGHYRFIPKKSVDVLPGMAGDFFVLDGDHNYWTVHHELDAIYSSNLEAWTILHDVGTPWARRDQYYAPEQIPAEHLHAYSYDHGVNLETGEVSYRSGFWGAGDFAIALDAGTPRNGVLTAIEDFLISREDLHYNSIPLIFGMGVIVPTRYANFVDETLRPYQGPLCEALERNRLDLYNDLLFQIHRQRRTFIRRWVNRLMDALRV